MTKKLFLLLAAMLLSCGASADELEVSLTSAQSSQEVGKILKRQDETFLVSHGPVSTRTSRAIFDLIVKGSNNEGDIIALGHFAAYTGDTELIRKMVYTYFGSAEGEAKTGYLERFLLHHPHLFFSLPDTYELWSHAGGAELGLDYPEEVERVATQFAFSTLDAKKILADITAHKGELTRE
jgi:hypothetical protein